MFRGPRQSRRVKIVKISGGRGGRGGGGGVNGGSGGLGEGPRVKILSARTVTNINKNFSTAPAVSDFRTIPLGDMDLQREIQLVHDSGVLTARRLHSARIEGSDVTRAVAVYQGDNAEEEWWQDIARYKAVRHPNIVQLYGTATYGNIHAAVFHDDLIPFQQFLDLYRHSHFSQAYIHVYMEAEFQAVEDYFKTAFQHSLDAPQFTFFIRRSTGRLCVDLVQGLKFLALGNSEATIIDSLTLDQYHSTCYWEISVPRFTSTSSAIVNLGSVRNWPSDDTINDVVEIVRIRSRSRSRSLLCRRSAVSGAAALAAA